MKREKRRRGHQVGLHVALPEVDAIRFACDAERDGIVDVDFFYSDEARGALAPAHAVRGSFDAGRAVGAREPCLSDVPGGHLRRDVPGGLCAGYRATLAGPHFAQSLRTANLGGSLSPPGDIKHGGL